MNKFSKFVGIDISKKTFDAAIYADVKGSRFEHQAFDQNVADYTAFLSWLQNHEVILQYTLFCMEHTVIYIHELQDFCTRPIVRCV